MKLTFLGTRGEMDLSTAHHRRHSSLLIAHKQSRVMNDCGLDWAQEVRRLRPHAIVLTHAHPDHAGGLRRGAPCPVYATSETWERLPRFPIADRRVVAHRRPNELGDIVFEAFPVEHSIRAPAVGYRVTAGGASFFDVPDVVSIRHRGAALSGVSLYVGDGASVHRALVRRCGERLIGHALVKTQLDWCRAAGVEQAIMTHCGSGSSARKAAPPRRSSHWAKPAGSTPASRTTA